MDKPVAHLTGRLERLPAILGPEYTAYLEEIICAGPMETVRYRLPNGWRLSLTSVEERPLEVMVNFAQATEKPLVLVGRQSTAERLFSLNEATKVVDGPALHRMLAKLRRWPGARVAGLVLARRIARRTGRPPWWGG